MWSAERACAGKPNRRLRSTSARNRIAPVQSLGVKKGDRVAIMLPNTLQYPVTLFAVLRLGAIVVNVNPLYTARELNHTLHDSGAEVIIVMETFAKTLQEAKQGTKLKHIVLTQIGD